MRSLTRLTTLLVLASLVAACSDQQPATQSNQTDTPTPSMHAPAIPLANKTALLDLLPVWAEQTGSAVSTLRARVERFVRAPDEVARKEALEAWQNAHDLFQVWQWLRQLGVFSAPLDESQFEPELQHSIWSRLDQDELIPGYLDEVEGYPRSGLMHTETPINAETLEHEHQFSDKAYVTLGFHALAFMLTGDLYFSRSTPRAEAFAALPNDALDPLRSAPLRRSLFVLQLAQQIDMDTQILLSAWREDTGAYLSQLRAMTPTEFEHGLQRLLAEPDPESHFASQTKESHRQLHAALAQDTKPLATPSPESTSDTASRE